MNVYNNTILITGGATGIGFELAKQFIARNNTVIICGRRQAKLDEAKKTLPGLITFQCDVSDIDQRRELFRFCTGEHPQVNILINNAGIQRVINYQLGESDYLNGDNEIAINLEAPVHLTALFVPHLLKQKESAIINVSSGLGLVPLVAAPVYSATKAALHSFSISLRRQLENTPIKVFEILPPIVETELHNIYMHRRPKMPKGISPHKVAVDSIKAMEKKQFEIAVGLNKMLRIGARISPKFFLNLINKNPPTGK